MIQAVGEHFAGELEFLSNFAESPIEVNLQTQPMPISAIVMTVEHGYQANKTLDTMQALEICRAETPGKAKRLGRQVTLRSDWEDIKIDVMWNLVARKFQNEPFRSKLLEMRGDIVEWNSWHDNVWGICTCDACPGDGMNKLGLILRHVRGELRSADEIRVIEARVHGTDQA